MAHFAQLNDKNMVIRVIVVDDKDTADANGVEKEYIGKAFCEKIFGGRWVQTSYNNNFRKRFAGIGMYYSEEADAFVGQQPYPSWTLDPYKAEWQSPVAKPTDGNVYDWDESNKVWVPV